MTPHDRIDRTPDGTHGTHGTTRRTAADGLRRGALLLAAGLTVLAVAASPGPTGPTPDPVLHLASTLAPDGYWLVGTDGGVFAYGAAGFHGSAGGLRLDAPVVGMAGTPDSAGYWLVASDGGVFAYGDASFHGSAGGLRLDAPVVGMAATPDGGGYWLVAADGGVFAYGSAGFHGSAGGLRLDAPVVGMAAAPDGGGYWLVAADGGVFAYGSAGFHGSAAGRTGSGSVVDLTPTPDGSGYWVADSAGGVLALGAAVSFGSAAGTRLAGPIVGMAPSRTPAVDPQDYALDGDARTALLPGTSSPIDLRITNPNPVPITVVSNSTTVSTGTVACDPSDFAMVHELGTPVEVPPRSTRSLSQLGVPQDDWPTVAMVETASDQDACQDLVLTLHYQGEAIG